ncbi:MAG: glycerol kinase GlpK, partial [Gemmataceae bacterium]
IVYDARGQRLGQAAREFKQCYPKPGWVEHDAEEIWTTVSVVVKAALAAARVAPTQLACIGLTNQRETTVLWDRQSGQPVARAIVWQDRRTSDFCQARQQDETWLHERSGLVLDPYFSATKIRWYFEQDAETRRRAGAGELAFGTIDSFLIWRMTGGKLHATERTNASRTLLLNLQSAAWDDELCKYFEVPRAILPEVRPSQADFGSTAGLAFLPDGIPIAGVAGDQQAALFGQLGFAAGSAKCTYGTGAFFLVHTGTQPIVSQHRLVSSLAATGADAKEYVLEGSIFVAGAAVQWLRDELKVLDSAEESEQVAAEADGEHPLLFVPAFVGLGAPYWVPEARGVLFGLTRDSSPADLTRAALEGVAFEVADIVRAANADTHASLPALQADGGMARNAWFLQRQADILGLPVVQAAESEATAQGAAFLAGLQVGLWSSQDDLRKLARSGRRFEPQWPADLRERRHRQWRKAVQAVIDFSHS